MNTPPKFLLWLLDVFCPTSRPDLKGDILEVYNAQAEQLGRPHANWALLNDILTVIPFKFIIKEKTTINPPNVMFATNLKIARRNLSKNKLYSLINVIGLSVGLAACLLITLFVKDELSFDKHFAGSDRIFRISGNYDHGGPDRLSSAGSTYLLQPMIEGEMKDVEAIGRIEFRSDLITVDGDKKYLEDAIIYADSTFFDIFALPFVKGDRSTALDEPASVVLDEPTAQKYFADRNPIGKTIELNKKLFTVTGIMKEFPRNSHFTGRIVFPISGIKQWYPDWVLTNASGISVFTYLRVNPNFNAADFEAKINKIIAARWGGDKPPVYFLQPLNSIHLESNLVGEIRANGSKTTVYAFSFIALIILVLASINYINLSMAGSLQRTKEVGVKRVLGSTTRMQISQFQTESFIIMLVSAFLAVTFTVLAMPLFNQVTEKQLDFNWFADGEVGIGLLAVACIAALVAGSIPVLTLLRKGTVEMLSDKLSPGGSKSLLRSSLIVFQFAISIALIASTLVVMDQIAFIRKKDLGIDPEQVVLIPFQTDEITSRYEVMRTEMQRNPSVLSVAASGDKVSRGISGWRPYQVNGKDNVTVPTIAVSYNFFETIGAKILEGRSFSPDYPSDAKTAYILNEEAVKFLNYKDPIGAPLFGYAFTGSKWTEKNARIIGVVKNFHFASLHTAITPVVFALGSDITEGYMWMEIKIASKNGRETIDYLKTIWDKMASEREFQFEFMDDSIQQNYQAEERFLKIFIVFSILSIVIGGLGLFGLTAFMTKRRTKEVGIRRIIGASTGTLIGILSKDFLKLVLISNLIGWPAAYYLMHSWLQNFAYRTPISVWLFIITALTALVIAFLAILYHSLKVSRAIPVRAFL